MRPKKITFSLNDPQGLDAGKLRISNVVRLHVDGFGLQNIILEARVFHRPDDSFEYGRGCQLLSLDKSNGDLPAGTKALIFIEASVGAEIACLLSQQPDLRLSP